MVSGVGLPPVLPWTVPVLNLDERGTRAKPRAGFWLNVQKQPVLESSGACSCQRNLSLILSVVVVRVAESQQEVH